MYTRGAAKLRASWTTAAGECVKVMTGRYQIIWLLRPDDDDRPPLLRTSLDAVARRWDLAVEDHLSRAVVRPEGA